MRAATFVLRYLRARSHSCWAYHACCGVVSNRCCDVSALRGAVFKPSPASAATAKARNVSARAKVLPCSTGAELVQFSSEKRKTSI
jgi:hypothetical protein